MITWRVVFISFPISNCRCCWAAEFKMAASKSMISNRQQCPTSYAPGSRRGLVVSSYPSWKARLQALPPWGVWTRQRVDSGSVQGTVHLRTPSIMHFASVTSCRRFHLQTQSSAVAKTFGIPAWIGTRRGDRPNSTRVVAWGLARAESAAQPCSFSLTGTPNLFVRRFSRCAWRVWRLLHQNHSWNRLKF